MSSTITYLQFHALFLLPPLFVLWATAARSGGRWGRSLWVGAAVVTALALGYTTPWDNYLVARGVWRYGEGAVVGRIWAAPVEEYLFVLLQPALTTLWLSRLRPPATDTGIDGRDRVLGTAAGALVGGAGLVFLRTDATLYLGAILAWSGPILAVQWGFGWPVLWRARRTLAVGVLVPTAYLWIADRIALWLGVWTLSGQYTTGIAVLGLPIEEAAFFLATNLFVVQGLLLFHWLVGRSPEPVGQTVAKLTTGKRLRDPPGDRGRT